MVQDYAKRMVTKDGKSRVTVWYDECATSPRDLTGEPLHCEDWDREYSIMNDDERKSKSHSAREFLEYMLNEYGNAKKIIAKLIENGRIMKKGCMDIDSALVYDRSRKGYVLYETDQNFFSPRRDNGWYENGFFDSKRDDLNLGWILECVSDEAIDYFANHYMTDEVKLASYGFGYDESVSFYDDVTTKSVGIAWLEKDEFMKYGGCDEDYWKKDLREIEGGLLKEIEAWAIGECYYFVLERAIDVDGVTEWESVGAYGGFYGNVDYAIEYACQELGIKEEELYDATYGDTYTAAA